MRAGLIAALQENLRVYSEAHAQPVPPGGVPHPASLKPQLRNDHLQYAMTWYGLALTLVGVFGFWARSRLRDKSGAA